MFQINDFYPSKNPPKNNGFYKKMKQHKDFQHW